MDLGNIHYQGLRDVLLAIEKRVQNHLTISPALAPGGTSTNFKVGAFSFILGGVTRNKAAADNVAAPGASTDSGEYRKILVCIDAAGVISVVAGAVASSQALAQLPSTPDDKLAIGVIELPESFVSGTTAVTSDMCKSVVQSIEV